MKAIGILILFGLVATIVVGTAEGKLLKREDDDDSAERGDANIRAIDSNGDGRFTPAEILAGGEAAGLTPEFTKELADKVNGQYGVADEETIFDLIAGDDE